LGAGVGKSPVCARAVAGGVGLGPFGWLCWGRGVDKSGGWCGQVCGWSVFGLVGAACRVWVAPKLQRWWWGSRGCAVGWGVGVSELRLRVRGRLVDGQ
jgi:hypothetical protein